MNPADIRAIKQKEAINEFLVQVFNDILRMESNSLKNASGNISLTELHVMEVVENAQRNGANTMAEIAASLGITAGTLTTSVKTLEKKGYLSRSKQDNDKRRVSVTLTEAAKPVMAKHRQFHEDLVSAALYELSENEADILAKSLLNLHKHFKSN